MSEPLLSVDDLAAFLGVKRDTVYKLIDRNQLPGFKIGRLWKFRQAEIDAWVERQSRRSRGGKSDRGPRGRGT